MRKLRQIIPVLLALSVAACATASGRGTTKAGIGAGKEGEGISRAELQDSLLRFEMNFNESLRDSFQQIEATAPAELRTQALRNWLLYTSSSLDIALGPVPESNLLDMMVFVELSSRVFERHWIPQVYGARGEPVLATFQQGRDELAKIALKVLTTEQIHRFWAAVDRWEDTHPEHVAVEGIRLSQIATETGAEAAELEEQASGMMANIKAATIAADQAVMLGERFLHYAQRLPFLARVQARLGAQEMLSDSAGIAGAAGYFLKEGTSTFREANRTLAVLNRELAAMGDLIGHLDLATNRLLIKGTLATLIIVLFTGMVMLAVRATLLKMERSNDSRPRDDREDQDELEHPPKLSARRRRG